MTKEELITKLEEEYNSDQELSIVIDLPHGLGETNYHRGMWRDMWGFTCTSSVGWKRGSLKTESMYMSDLIDLLKEKDLSEMVDSDFPCLELGETWNGNTDVKDIEWDNQPPEEDLDELDTMELYNESEITDCEYEFSEGQVESLTIKVRKDTLFIDRDGYTLNLAPRIKNWTEKDKDDLEARTLVAITGLMDVQSTYNLILESEVTENLPHFDMDASDAPVLRVKTFEVETETDVTGKEVITLVVWAENGPAVRIQVTNLADAIRLRNMLSREIDGFGRGYSQTQQVEEGWEPPAVDYDFGDDDDDEG
jgi:hypothetical protein